MESSDPTWPPRAEADRALPRAVIRLLRSGSLDEARTRRVLEVHGLEDATALERIVAPARARKPEA